MFNKLTISASVSLGSYFLLRYMWSVLQK